MYENAKWRKNFGLEKYPWIIMKNVTSLLAQPKELIFTLFTNKFWIQVTWLLSQTKNTSNVSCFNIGNKINHVSVVYFSSTVVIYLLFRCVSFWSILSSMPFSSSYSVIRFLYQLNLLISQKSPKYGMIFGTRYNLLQNHFYI